MRCLHRGAIARAVTLRIDDPHFDECLTCRRRLNADRSIRATLALLPIRTLSEERRRELAAEVVALAENTPSGRSSPRPHWVIGAAVAVAAGLVAGATWQQSPVSETSLEVAAVTAPESASMKWTLAANEEAPPVQREATVHTLDGTVFKHLFDPDHDTITLFDGTIDLDTRHARNVLVRIGDSTIRVDDGSVKIVARKRAIISVQVVVGTAHIDNSQHHLTLQRDAVWIPGPSAKQRSLEIFRDAWTALRDGNAQQAMQLFDRVTDPVALEEATYWAAVAARRVRDPSAAERAAKFLERYPQSDYAASLRAE